ncbi:ABC-type nitrate/sulfonate/bicarbonate transport system ATPase subunit [Salirhabdus euzebyi]|uniref:ABC-type nitrate/sulfonate/bicarbonate transport system ATPase subunit n=1 Tax=Salirhabdus euzebyi TaxID=394506 RepID=A0A841Q475_9BACI|nr:ABC transporter ATP-binding protein [Salirhabdus euzebyi]MBB6453221.1 ABC-type nitrate/sulfonate/bicarbonate transport system ATPase subunit [Salirhabdus euzebyi]
MSHLKIEHIEKSYGERSVLKDVSFSVQEGEFVSLLGPSGSGKSTLFRIIGGMTAPLSGAVYLEGEDITGKRGSISYTPQSPSLMPWRTTLQNVLLGQEIVGKKDEEKARDMLERAGLKGYEQAYPHELSGGMKQRASFIRSILSPQSLILLDEPFSALDEFTRLDMQQWLLSIWSEYKRSILFVTHNIEEAIFLSDRIIVLSDRPATVVKEFNIPFDRPRREDLLLTEEFLHWKKLIYQEMRVLNE